MHRGLGLFALACSLVISTFSAQSVLAQSSAEPQDGLVNQAAQSTIEGTWLVTVNVISPQGVASSFQALQTYTADGHIIGTTNQRDGGPHHGEWRWTGGSQYLATIVTWEFDDDGPTVMLRVRSSLTLSGDGDSFGGPFEVDVTTPDGRIPIATTTGTQEGTRITVDR
jgi:hypothetical protein